MHIAYLAEVEKLEKKNVEKPLRLGIQAKTDSSRLNVNSPGCLLKLYQQASDLCYYGVFRAVKLPQANGFA